ncbi:lysophospholipase, partial [Xanthomonas oryzae pv. oryzae]
APLTDPRPRTPAAHAFWAETIHPDRFRALRSLFQVVATDPPWPRVRCPVLLGDDRATDGREDANASVQAMLDMFVALGTAPAHKQAIAFYSGAHAIGSPHKTPLADAVAQASVAFLQEQLGAAPQTGNA